VSHVSRGSKALATDRDDERSGLICFPEYFALSEQRALFAAIASVVNAAPLFQPTMPRTGRPFSVMMTNCGPLGWVSDRAGYRYQNVHPETGSPWPTIPVELLALWRTVSGYPADPQACLVNVYSGSAKMGSHQDRDEDDFSAPVVSISLGRAATFHIGGTTRAGPKTRMILKSGDVLVMGGPSRLAFHGIDKIHQAASPFDLSSIDPDCARVNLTLRRVTSP
jgi:DNA oxidative demethylase